MIDFIDTAADVLALTIAGTISGDDLDRIIDRLDAAMAADGKLHIFVETRGIVGIELSGLPAYAARAWPLFGKLARFGRVAVVADQRWLRAGTRIESALLPGIDYRVFEPAQRDAALAWVEGRGGATPG